MPTPEQPPQNGELFPLDHRVAILQSEDTTPEEKERAFRSVCEEHYQDMVRYATFLTRSYDNGEDITQEAFAKVWSKIEQYKSGKVPFKAWLVRIVHNQAVDFKKKAYIRNESSFDLGRGYITLEDEFLPLEEPTIGDVDESLIFQDTLTSLREHIPHHELKPLIQSILGLTYNEISEVDNLTHPAITARIHRARLAAQSIINDQRAA